MSKSDGDKLLEKCESFRRDIEEIAIARMSDNAVAILAKYNDEIRPLVIPMREAIALAELINIYVCGK